MFRDEERPSLPPSDGRRPPRGELALNFPSLMHSATRKPASQSSTAPCLCCAHSRPSRPPSLPAGPVHSLANGGPGPRATLPVPPPRVAHRDATRVGRSGDHDGGSSQPPSHSPAYHRTLLPARPHNLRQPGRLRTSPHILPPAPHTPPPHCSPRCDAGTPLSSRATARGGRPRTPRHPWRAASSRAAAPPTALPPAPPAAR